MSNATEPTAPFMSQIVYRIKNWEKTYENNRSRKVEKLKWVPIPNNHDGENYSRLMQRKDAAEIFSGWILILQVASKCQPRGKLVRSDGQPHDSESISLKTRAPKAWFDKAFSVLVPQWIEAEIPKASGECHQNGSHVSPACLPGDEEEKEGKRIEEKGKEDILSGNATQILAYLNEKTGSAFKPVAGSLKHIRARLKEGATVEECKSVVDNRVAAWSGDSKMRAYLRPQTLFNSEKFPSYLGQSGSIPTRKGFLS